MVINIQDDLLKIHKLGLLDKLLVDKTTKKNIMWATNAYCSLGARYERNEAITPELITGPNASVIKTRARKAMEQQSERTRQHAEVFTPLWICQKMNDHADEVWFGSGEVFFSQGKPTPSVVFPPKKNWKKYVDSRRLEITCGEAPYLVSRYDVETGEMIPIPKRVGLLDRKLRVVNENAQDEAEWLEWVVRAFQVTYGFEFQGDNVLIARVNLLMTFEEYLQARWEREPTDAEWEKLINIIAWNIWQMDGLSGTIPYGTAEEEFQQMDLFGMFAPAPDAKGENRQPNCRIFNWCGDVGRSSEYLTLKRKGHRAMKFDFVIGNPPYQEEVEGSSDKPIYNDFMDAVYGLSDKVELITPARFLFNAGKTPKAWNKKMLADNHLKVLLYQQDSSQVFPNTSINGGVAITYRDTEQDFGAIEVFTTFEELRSIQEKIRPFLQSGSITDIMILQNRFNLDVLYNDFPECAGIISSGGKERRIVSSAFEKLPVFRSESGGNNDVKILGVVASKRQYRWVNLKYIEDNGNLHKWKVFVPKSNGASGTLGEQAARIISKPVLGQPGEGITQTFIGVGAFNTEGEAQAALKYVKSKFARALLGILKITQDNPPERWRFVPLPDFSSSSDIDWSKSSHEVDQQLYAKYSLDEKEIQFIETHVKEMV